MKNLITTIFLLSLIISCTVKPQEINYGSDACQYCSMTIVDRQHAAQLVTDKGKCFKFDAIECMIQYLQENNTSIAYYLAADFQNPGKLIDAKKASFIISENIPSPMRANLSALGDLQQAAELQKEKSGELYTWEELVNHLKQ